MVSKRRSFLKNSSILTSCILLGSSLEAASSFYKKKEVSLGNTLSILHTSDLSGHLAPTAGPFGGLKKVDQIFLRRNKSTLKIDSGNFLKLGSELNEHIEIIKRMNKMGYFATTPGLNELNMGQEQLASILPIMDFEMVNCNYKFSNTILSSRIKPYFTFNVGKIKIGITGVGNYISIPGIQVSEPIQAVNDTARKLKKDLQCDLIICLTQFGQDQKNYNDKKLAEASKYIDLIIGGEICKVAKVARSLKNANKYDVLISQAGSKGKTVGELTYEFNQFNTITSLKHNYSISGMSEYATLTQKNEVFRLLTSVG
ncbi:MAG: hypothetical protein WC623_02925 [Pedobacter sp.]|uniref:hypothetical protein n=1 Tax=Pedobacter sp. TaxID=1411316 RepID=UPI0035618259